MNTRTITEPVIRHRINHDSMWMSCKFPSGGYFKLTFLRYKRVLDLRFSNDEDELQRQVKIFDHWVTRNTRETSYGNVFKRLADMCGSCNTGQELITKMK